MSCPFPQKFQFPFTRLEAGVRDTPGQGVPVPYLPGLFFPPPPPSSALPSPRLEGNPDDIKEGRSEVQARDGWGTTEL